MEVLITTFLAFQCTQLVSCMATSNLNEDGPTCDAHSHATCAQEAATSKWTVEGFDYHTEYIYTTPAHQNSHGYVDFGLTNAAVAYTATCSATGDQLPDFFYGTQWYPCTLPSAAPAGAGVSFRFDRETGELGVNGTIMCSENGQGAPTAVPVEGTTSLTLTCNDTTWTNPNYTFGSGEFYSTREVQCAPATAVF